VGLVKRLVIMAVTALIRGCAAHVPMRVWEHVWGDVKEPVGWPVMEHVLVLLPIKPRQKQPLNETLANVSVINIRMIQLKANRIWKED